MKKVVVTLMTMMALWTTACQKNNSSTPTPVTPVYPNCQYGQTAGCGVGNYPGTGAVNYGGTFVQNMLAIQGNFQVSGTNPSGGTAQLTGTMIFSQPYYCYSQALIGQMPISSLQAGQMSNGGVFTGYVMVGNQQAYAQIIPTQQPGTGLFSIQISGCQRMDFNF